ncbi:MAG: hypothetical protein Q4F95_04350 [Oscillospiraceae bacterium]|nr:hypothetical protein [Oscillospiraceae bacterium]
MVEMLTVHLSKSSCRYTAVYTRNENEREHILNARARSYVNQNMINITGRKTAKTKWQ